MRYSRKQHEHEHEHEEESHHISEMMDPDGPIWVNEFTESAARAFVKQLQYQSRKDPNSPILIYIDSGGGDIYALFTMIAAMESVPNKIVTCALSKAMSAGAVLLACGDIRFVSEHSSVMVHEISAGTGGHIEDINTQYSNITKLNEKLMKLLAKKCNIKGGITALKKKLSNSRDLYLDPEDAIEFGLADQVGIPTMYKEFSVEYVLSSNPRGTSDAKKAKN